MQELVFKSEKGTPVTTSLLVAQKFEKSHKDVLKAIRNLECSKEFHQRNFAPIFYTNVIGNGATRKDPYTVMTRHEKTCFHNPVMRACATCDNLEQVEFTREMPFVSSRPMCRAGIEISQLNSNSVLGYEVKLQSECDNYHQK